MAPCYQLPIQPACKVLNAVQQYSFNTIEGTYKTLTVFVIKLLMDFIVSTTKFFFGATTSRSN
jgi:hypothetical protein